MLILQRIIAVFFLNALLISCQLYTKNDSVTIFQPQSFHLIFNDKVVENWFIQFYHSYCGHCINFSPIFKQFMKEAQHWNRVIRFGVVDCSQNKDLCNEQNVVYYPYFKFYLNKNYNNSSPMGEKIKLPHKDLPELYDGVIKTIIEKLNPNQLIETRPDDNKMGGNHFFLTGGNEVDLKRTILTFSGRLLYPLYFQYKDNQTDYKVDLVMGSDSVSHKATNLAGLYKWLSQYLNDQSETKTFILLETVTTPPIYKPNNTRSSIVPPVYNQDIYSSIYYAFTNDITDELLTNRTNVIILKNFVEKLYLYSDISERFTANFKDLMLFLQQKIDSLTGRSKFVMRWSDMLRFSKFPNIEPSWIGCNGSLPHLRRYPCGLWTMFHSLTVSHHVKVKSKEIKHDGSLDLIRSIREFIFTFFACRECADNFKLETASFESRVLDSSKAVIYLWQVHNSVNKRLAHAPSEDPYHPKLAFPSEWACPTCRVAHNVTWPRPMQWSYPDVLNFLIHHYSNMNRVQFLTQPALLLKTSNWFFLGPSSIDISICVILSVFCSFVVILAFVKYFIKSKFCTLRKYRRAPLIT